MRILALDVGEKRIGIAISDPLGFTAQGVETLVRTELAADCARIAELAQQYQAEKLLVGLPRNMDGGEGEQAKYTRIFADAAAQVVQIPILYWDERLTTRAAHSALIEGGMRRNQRKGVVDRIAACILLQSYLDSPRTEESTMKKEPQEGAILEIEDPEGGTLRFEHVITLEVEDKRYALVVPIAEDLEEDVMVALEIVTGEDADSYVAVEDEALLDTLYDLYLEAMDEEEEEDPE